MIIGFLVGVMTCMGTNLIALGLYSMYCSKSYLQPLQPSKED